jgi:endonuclease-3 related protein
MTKQATDTCLREALLEIYARLEARYGSQHWWPADGPFEVMVGAVLTQQAAWTNAERAIANLKAAGALSPRVLRCLPAAELAQLIRPSLYHNAKAGKLKALASWLGDRYQDDLAELFRQDVSTLRRQLLSVYGIGEETADSIILYAAGKPVFVIDAYTRRILSRLGLEPAKNTYRAYQSLFTSHLPEEAGLFNEYHALLVRLGKEVCRSRPLCGECCLVSFCRYRDSL